MLKLKSYSTSDVETKGFKLNCHGCLALLNQLQLNLLHGDVSAQLLTTLSTTPRTLELCQKREREREKIHPVPPLAKCTPPPSCLLSPSKKKKAHLALRAPPGPPLGTPPRRELGLPKCFCSCSPCVGGKGGGGGERSGKRGGIPTQTAFY